MNNSINNNFIRAINSSKIQGYSGAVKLTDGRIVITPSFSKKQIVNDFLKHEMPTDAEIIKVDKTEDIILKYSGGSKYD